MIRDTSAQDTIVTPPPRFRNRRFVLLAGAAVGVLIAVVLLMTAWRGSTQSVNASRLRIAAVTVGTLVRDASVNGRVVAAVSPTLFSTAVGTVTYKVNAGDKVKKGAVLAEVDSPDVTDQWKREQASFEQLQAEVARQQILARKQKLLARRDADQAEIDRSSAELTLQRMDAAGGPGVVSKNDYLKAKDTLKSAEIRAKHAAAAADLENDDVALELKTKESQLERQRLTTASARQRVEDLKVKAPVDGVVGSLAVANRTVVQANVALLTVVDLSALEVELEIPETYVADLGLGMTVEITAGENKVVGKLAALSPEVLKNIVLARVRFSGAQPAGLRQSQRVSARLLIDERPNVLMVQRGPFVENEGGRFAYVVENGVAERRPIKLGATSVSAVEILEGLKAGDKIVIAGTDTFENAARISIND